jgi:hypothetical protein
MYPQCQCPSFYHYCRDKLSQNTIVLYCMSSKLLGQNAPKSSILKAARPKCPLHQCLCMPSILMGENVPNTSVLLSILLGQKAPKSPILVPYRFSKLLGQNVPYTSVYACPNTTGPKCPQY